MICMCVYVLERTMAHVQHPSSPMFFEAVSFYYSVHPPDLWHQSFEKFCFLLHWDYRCLLPNPVYIEKMYLAKSCFK